MNDFFGIDPNEAVTPIDVRNAIIECFTSAHGKELAQSLNVDPESDADVIRENIVTFIRGAFDKTRGSFEKPTKESLLKLVEELKKFSGQFRDQSIIKEHAASMMKLIDKLD